MDKTWFEKAPVCIFIDTSALRGMAFNFSNRAFKTIHRGIAADDLQLLVSDISEGEFKKHLEIVLTEETNRIKSLGAYRTLFDDRISELAADTKKVNSDQIWKKYVSDFKAKNISCSVKWQLVFSDYFNKKAPFEKKSDEFADAFNIKMIEAYAPEKLVIISSDNDFDSWVKGQTNAVKFFNPKDFVDAYLNIRDPLAPLATKAIESLAENIIHQMNYKYSDNYHYSVVCAHSEIVDANVDKLAVAEHTLLSTDAEDDSAVLNLRLRGNTELELSCPVVVYDSVDKEDFTLGYNSRIASVDFEINLTLNLKLNVNDLTNSTFEIEEEDFISEDFEVPHEWTSFLDPDESEFD